MRTILVTAAVIALGACQQTAEAPPAEEAAPSAAAAAQTVVPGSYEVTTDKGEKSVTTINADGTYSGLDVIRNDEAKGTWAEKDGKVCFMREGAAEECWTNSTPAADGSFTSTSPDGMVVQVRPQAK